MPAPELLVRGGPLWAGPGSWWPQGAVAATGGVITYAGPAEGAPATAERVIEAHGGLIMPGLVNAHCHGAMALFRGWADDLPLEVWLQEHIFPAEARWINEQTVELCTLLAAGEMLLAGVTTVGDAYFCMHGAARAYEQAGLRALVGQGLIDFPAPGAPEPARNLAVCREFIEAWQGRSELITPGVFAHSPYTCSPDTLRGAAALCAELDCRLFTHLAETREETAQCRARHGRSPVGHLESLGLLERLDAAVHCVWLEPGEEALLARRGVAVIACPESNSKLGAGWADLTGLLAAGCQVALGTDGPASNNDLDVLSEVSFAARLAKVKTGDPAALPAEQALDLALAGGAAALGLTGVVGRLEPGYGCDLIVLELNQPHLTPLYDAASHLVYAASSRDVRQVVVAGRQVVAERRVLSFDLPGVMARVRELAGRVAAGRPGEGA
ncbi:MAG: amidohydrolase [Desulfarculus sp.]|nr:MAG: amidohydrolase [Desulfarculus sp.]